MRADCAGAATAPVVAAELPARDADLRDLLDRKDAAPGAPRPDVIVTRDPNTISYAANNRSFLTMTLPYDRTYSLISGDSTAMPSQAERDALARDAVTADVRGALDPLAWPANSPCSALPIQATVPPRPIVAYAAGDMIARQLAERIVALAGGAARPAWLPARVASGSAPRVSPISADSINAALATGRVAAAVVALPRDAQERCGTKYTTFPWNAIRLVDSRAHAIVRRGSGAAFVINDDGTLHFLRRPKP